MDDRQAPRKVSLSSPRRLRLLVKKHLILSKLTLVTEHCNGRDKWTLKIKGRKPSKQTVISCCYNLGAALGALKKMEVNDTKEKSCL